MNILPLVSAFILIFAIGSYTFVHNQLCSIQERQHFFGAISASHKYARTLQSKRYRKIKGENLFPQKPSEGELKETEYKSPRDRDYPYEQAKLNIQSMIGADTTKLDALFVSFVDHLYQFFPEKGTRQPGKLLLKLIKKGKTLSSLEQLLKIVDDQDREFVYKLLKGTQNVNLDQGIGYPALGDYIRIGDKREKPVHICHAARPLLEILCGPHIAPMIILEEKLKWEPEHKHIPITRDELVPLLLSRDFNLTSIEDFIDFSRKIEVLQEEITEVKGIKIRHNNV